MNFFRETKYSHLSLYAFVGIDSNLQISENCTWLGMLCVPSLYIPWYITEGQSILKLRCILCLITFYKLEGEIIELKKKSLDLNMFNI